MMWIQSMSGRWMNLSNCTGVDVVETKGSFRWRVVVYHGDRSSYLYEGSEDACNAWWGQRIYETQNISPKIYFKGND